MFWEFIVISVACYLTHLLLLHYHLRRQAAIKELKAGTENTLTNDDINHIQTELENRGYLIRFPEAEATSTTKEIKEIIETQPHHHNELPLHIYIFATNCIPQFEDAELLLTALEKTTQQYGNVVFKEHPDDVAELSLDYNRNKHRFECVYSNYIEEIQSRRNEWLNREETLTFLKQVIDKYIKEYV